MPYPQKSLSELLSLLQQARGLLLNMYRDYLRESPFSQEEMLAELAGDKQRLQALLDKEVVESDKGGYRLSPGWMLFFQQESGEGQGFSIDKLTYHLRLAEKIAFGTESASAGKDLLIQLRAARQEWILLIESREKIEPEMYPELSKLRELWNSISWKGLQSIWKLNAEWDAAIMSIWEESEEILAQLDFLDQAFLPKTREMPDVIEELLMKKRENPAKMVRVAAAILREEDSLLFQKVSTRATRPDLDFFKQKNSSSLSKKIKGKKKLALQLERPTNIPLPEAGFHLPAEDLMQLLEDFSTSALELKAFIGEHPRSKELNAQKQLDLFYYCLFQYQDQWVIEEEEGNNGEIRVYAGRKK